MKLSDTVSRARTQAFGEGQPQPESLRFIPVPVQYTIYVLALALSISIWLIAIRAPLWLDETVSMYLIRGGFTGITSRQVWPDAPAYSCLLWLWTKVMGTGEIALRISSVLAMLAAVYLLYCAARELFDRDVAIVAAIVFCLHPIVIFAAIDVRPYAIAAVAVTSSILALVHLRNNDSNWLAALFGLSAACIAQFQLLFAVILPALAICFVALKFSDRKTLWRQLAIALAVFGLGFLPLILRLHYMVHTSGTHVFEAAPPLMELVTTLASRKVAILFVGTVLVAALLRRLDLKNHLAGWPILLCTSLALVPILLLYGVSVGTSIHVFVPRYRLVAIPGLALCYALALSRVDSRILRLLFCCALVSAAAYHSFSSASSRQHGYTWKYALEFAQKKAAEDNATVLICSDLPESNYMKMPVGSAIEDSGILPSVSYYKLTVPIVPLPRALNQETLRAGSQFLQEAGLRHERFLAVASFPSYNTLEWVGNYAAKTHNVQELGIFDGIKVLEFIPRTQGMDAP